MLLFFFKQKTAYDMRISDWSSDVCPSDLSLRRQALHQCRDHIGLVDHGHDSLRSTHGFKRGYGILFAVINVDVGTQRQGVRRNITASSNGNHLETHVPRVLQRHMTQAANTQDRSEERRVGKEGVSTGR